MAVPGAAALAAHPVATGLAALAVAPVLWRYVTGSLIISIMIITCIMISIVYYLLLLSILFLLLLLLVLLRYAKPTPDVAGKVVFVTGGSEGIGKAQHVTMKQHILTNYN